MNSVLISTNDGNYYRITVKAEKPGMNILSVWDDINNVLMRDKPWLIVLGGDDIEIKEKMSSSSVSALVLNIKNICSIELFKED